MASHLQSTDTALDICTNMLARICLCPDVCSSNLAPTAQYSVQLNNLIDIQYSEAVVVLQTLQDGTLSAITTGSEHAGDDLFTAIGSGFASQWDSSDTESTRFVHGANFQSSSIDLNLAQLPGGSESINLNLLANNFLGVSGGLLSTSPSGALQLYDRIAPVYTATLASENQGSSSFPDMTLLIECSEDVYGSGTNGVLQSSDWKVSADNPNLAVSLVLLPWQRRRRARSLSQDFADVQYTGPGVNRIGLQVNLAFVGDVVGTEPPATIFFEGPTEHAITDASGN